MADGTVAAVIHGLALARYDGSTTVYRFSCSAEWETEPDAEYESIEEPKRRLPNPYRRVRPTWIKA